PPGSRCRRTGPAFFGGHPADYDDALFAIRRGSRWRFPARARGRKTPTERDLCDIAGLQSWRHLQSRRLGVAACDTILTRDVPKGENIRVTTGRRWHVGAI